MVNISSFKLKVLANISWLTIDQFVRMFVNALVGIAMARFMGKELFGTYNYCLVLVSIFAPLLNFGFDGYIIRDLIRSPEKRNEILGTSFILRLIGALATIVMVFISINILRPEHELSVTLTLLLSFGYILQSFDVIDLFFKAHLKSKFTVLTKGLSFVAISLFKIYLFYIHAPLIAFGYAFSLEFLLAGVLLIYTYKRRFKFSIKDWYLTIERAFYIIKEGWPMLLSMIFTIAFTRVDQIMTGKFLDDKAVGGLSASTKIFEIAVAAIMILNTSFFPLLNDLFIKDRKKFFEKYALISEIYALVSYGIFIVIFFFGENIITIMFGEEFRDTYKVLRLQMLAFVLIANGGLRSAYCTISNNQRLLLYITAISTFFNISLNLYMIPHYGIYGAGISMFFTQIIALQITNLLFKDLKPIFWIQIQSFFLLNLFRTGIKFLKRS